MSNYELKPESKTLLKKYNRTLGIRNVIMIISIFLGAFALLSGLSALVTATAPGIVLGLKAVTIVVLTLGFALAFNDVPGGIFPKEIDPSEITDLKTLTAGGALGTAITISTGIACEFVANRFKNQYLQLEWEGIYREYKGICASLDKIKTYEKIKEVEKLNAELKEICENIVTKEKAIKEIEGRKDSLDFVKQIKKEILGIYKQDFIEKCNLIEAKNEEISKDLKTMKDFENNIKEFRNIIIREDEQCKNLYNDLNDRYKKLNITNCDSDYNKSVSTYQEILNEYKIPEKIKGLNNPEEEKNREREAKNLSMENISSKKSQQGKTLN